MKILRNLVNLKRIASRSVKTGDFARSAEVKEFAKTVKCAWAVSLATLVLAITSAVGINADIRAVSSSANVDFKLSVNSVLSCSEDY